MHLKSSRQRTRCCCFHSDFIRLRHGRLHSTHTHTHARRACERERETKPKHSHVQSVEWGTREGVACNLNLPQAVLYLAGKLGNENCKSAACKSVYVTEESWECRGELRVCCS